MSDAYAAFGITIERENVAVAEIIDSGDIEKAIQQIDVTHHGAPGGYRQYIASEVIDPPEFTFLCNYLIGDTTGQRAIEGDFAAKTISEYKVTFPNGRSFTGDALVKKYKLIGKLEEQIKFEVTLQFTGALDDGYTASAGLTTPFFAVSESAVVVPSPANDVYEYVATVLTGVSSVTVTPTASAGVITVNGNVVTSGQASSAIALGAAGSVTEIEIVVSESGKAPVTYYILVARAAS